MMNSQLRKRLLFSALITVIALIISGGVSFAEDLNKLLINASIDNDIEKARELIEAGADLNTINKQGGTPIGYAIELQNTEIVQLLVEEGANIDFKDANGWTQLMRATVFSNPQIIRILIGSGIDLNETNNKGETVLILSIKAQRTKYIITKAQITSHIITVVLEEGVDINVADNDGKTAMDYAKAKKLQWVIDKLKEFGAKE